MLHRAKLPTDVNLRGGGGLLDVQLLCKNRLDLFEISVNKSRMTTL